MNQHIYISQATFSRRRSSFCTSSLASPPSSSHVYLLGLPAGSKSSKLFIICVKFMVRWFGCEPRYEYTIDKVYRIVTQSPKSCGDVRKHLVHRTMLTYNVNTFYVSNSKADYGDDCETERKAFSQTTPLHSFGD
jgi:hypothetical protein